MTSESRWDFSVFLKGILWHRKERIILPAGSRFERTTLFFVCKTCSYEVLCVSAAAKAIFVTHESVGVKSHTALHIALNKTVTFSKAIYIFFMNRNLSNPYILVKKHGCISSIHDTSAGLFNRSLFSTSVMSI